MFIYEFLNYVIFLFIFFLCWLYKPESLRELVSSLRFSLLLDAVLYGFCANKSFLVANDTWDLVKLFDWCLFEHEILSSTKCEYLNSIFSGSLIVVVVVTAVVKTNIKLTSEHQLNIEQQNDCFLFGACLCCDLIEHLRTNCVSLQFLLSQFQALFLSQVSAMIATFSKN